MSAAGWFVAGVLTAFGASALFGLVVAAMIQPADDPDDATVTGAPGFAPGSSS